MNELLSQKKCIPDNRKRICNASRTVRTFPDAIPEVLQILARAYMIRTLLHRQENGWNLKEYPLCRDKHHRFHCPHNRNHVKGYGMYIGISDCPLLWLFRVPHTPLLWQLLQNTLQNGHARQKTYQAVREHSVISSCLQKDFVAGIHYPYAYSPMKKTFGMYFGLAQLFPGLPSGVIVDVK